MGREVVILGNRALPDICTHGNWMDQYHWNGGGRVNYAAEGEGENCRTCCFRESYEFMRFIVIYLFIFYWAWWCVCLHVCVSPSE